MEHYLCVGLFYVSCSPLDELDVAPVSSELMFAPQQRRFTVSGGESTVGRSRHTATDILCIHIPAHH